MNRALNEFESQQQYTYMTYLKGMIMFGQVNEVMGDKKFEAALRKYFDTCKLKLATKTICLPALKKATAPIFPICSIPLSMERTKP